MVGESDWFEWVPAHLDQVADRLDAEASDSGGTAQP